MKYKLNVNYNDERQIQISVAATDGVSATLDAWLVLDEIQINDVFVNDSYRRQGIASAMLNQLIDFGKKHTCTKISLEVRAQNEAARALYDKLGFVQVGMRKDFYSNPTDDAILMDKTL